MGSPSIVIRLFSYLLGGRARKEEEEEEEEEMEEEMEEEAGGKESARTEGERRDVKGM